MTPNPLVLLIIATINSVRVAGDPKPNRRLNYGERRYKPPRTSGGILALPADSSPLWCAYTTYAVAQIVRAGTGSEVSTIAEIARVVSLLSVPDNMIKGDGSETRFR